MRRESKLCQHVVISPNRLDRRDFAIDDEPQKLDERQLALGLVNLATKEGRAAAVFANVVNQLERVERGAGRPAQHADDQVRIVVDEFFECPRAVVNHLEKQGPTVSGDAGQSAGNYVIDKCGHLLGRQALRRIGVKDLEKVAKVVTLGLFAKLLVFF